MEEIDQRILAVLETLRPTPRIRYLNDWLITAGLAAVGAIVFFAAIQTTKPADVLAQVQELQSKVQMLTDDTAIKPKDVLAKVEELQIEIQLLNEEVKKLKGAK